MGLFFLEELTLLWFQLQTMFPESIQNFIQSGKVFFDGFSENDDIVKVDNTSGPLETCQSQLHQPGKGLGGIAEAHWH